MKVLCAFQAVMSVGIILLQAIPESSSSTWQQCLQFILFYAGNYDNKLLVLKCNLGYEVCYEIMSVFDFGKDGSYPGTYHFEILRMDFCRIR